MAIDNNHRRRTPAEKQKDEGGRFPLPADSVRLIEKRMGDLLDKLQKDGHDEATYKKATEVLIERCSLYSSPARYGELKERFVEYTKQRIEKLLQQLEQGNGSTATCHEIAKLLKVWSEIIDKGDKKTYNGFIERLKPHADKNMEAFLQKLEHGDKSVYEQADAMLNVLIQLRSKTACKPITKKLSQYKEMTK